MKKHTKNIILSFVILLILGLIVYITNNTIQKQPNTNRLTTQQINTKQDNEHLSWADFQKKAQEKNTVVIDIRTPEEIAQGTLFKNIQNIDYYDPTFEEQVSQLDPTKTYLIYCRSGHRSGNAISLFKKDGLHVYDLQDGYLAAQKL